MPSLCLNFIVTVCLLQVGDEDAATDASARNGRFGKDALLPILHKASSWFDQHESGFS